MKKKLVVLSGAGISAESGIQTFRDSDGLWEGHNVMEVATPEGFRKNPALVLDFYNKRRQQLLTVKPNEAHYILADLEKYFDIQIITQNVDDLHERAGSSNVLHLHGELLKVRSTQNPNYVLDWKNDLLESDKDEKGFALRPHIVWFGEEVPALDEAVYLTTQANLFLVVGTSLQVYPAAGLVDFVPPQTPIYYIDPKPIKIPNLRNELIVFAENASKGMQLLKDKLTQ
ncbi:NAD-dependent deacylase [Flavobacterium sp.]|uniref:SIR2 family NAD-dependent protein deacylase n=1 Tax=Flavobacterium sp. TaxID=239 RepID=UPI0026379F79|nr:NAD-dependent deacylase [Flavobacterium sp.]MDD3004640.1 NAD-dependent deacylase [Flavobacterium sp.]